MRLIDANKLIEKIVKWLPVEEQPLYDEENRPTQLNLVTSMLLEIEDQPTIEGRIHAHWEDKKGKEYCSACGKEKFDGLYADIYEYWDIPCCPHCGAEMDEVIKNV